MLLKDHQALCARPNLRRSRSRASSSSGLAGYLADRQTSARSQASQLLVKEGSTPDDSDEAGFAQIRVGISRSVKIGVLRRSKKSPGKSINIDADPTGHYPFRDANHLVSIGQRSRLRINFSHGCRQSRSGRAAAIWRTVALNEMIQDDGIS